LTIKGIESKIYSIVISSILAFAVIAGIPAVFAQNDTMSMDNSTSSLMNATLPTSVMNVTLAFAQENDTGMTSEGVEMDDMNQNQGNETGGVTQGQSNEAKNDGNNEEEESDDE
jgi:hypothetical protein